MRDWKPDLSPRISTHLNHKYIKQLLLSLYVVV